MHSLIFWTIAVVTIIDSTTNLEELCYALQTLNLVLGFPTAPVIVFHGIHFTEDVLHELDGCTNRQVIFVDVSNFFQVFPYDFTPTPGVDYSRQQGQHFLISDLWEAPHIKEYDVILRISDSTCLTMKNYDLPGFTTHLPDGHINSKLVYQTQSIPNNYVISEKYIDNLVNSTSLFMKANHLVPKNAELWTEIVNYQNGSGSMPKFSNAFEIIRKEFMLRRDVRAYNNFVSELKADEFYNNKWAADVVRYLTIAIFATPEETYIKHVPGYIEKDFLGGNVFKDICRIKPFGLH